MFPFFPLLFAMKWWGHFILVLIISANMESSLLAKLSGLVLLQDAMTWNTYPYFSVIKLQGLFSWTCSNQASFPSHLSTESASAQVTTDLHVVFPSGWSSVLVWQRQSFSSPFSLLKTLILLETSLLCFYDSFRKPYPPTSLVCSISLADYF